MDGTSNKEIEKAITEAVAKWPVSYYLGKDPAEEEAEINALAENVEDVVD